MNDQSGNFYTRIPVFDDFSKVVDQSVYRPMPDDWFIGLTDVVGSTKAIEAGGYKSVNMAGAAAISAIMNAVGHRDFPFVFGGDGVSFAVPPELHDAAADALARTARWVEDDLDLMLRIAMVPVREIRENGHDVRVARFGASEALAYAMFTGRGVEWAEDAMKRDLFRLETAPSGARPDLTGLSCGWKPIENRRGCILSMIVGPEEAADEAAYDDIVGKVVALMESGERGGHPIPEIGPDFGIKPTGVDLQARATVEKSGLFLEKLKIVLVRTLAWLLFRTGWNMGNFDPTHYRRAVGLNTDFRKFDDLLRMTVDCDPETLQQVKSILESAKAAGIVRYGLYEQDAAIMTCIVPSLETDDHLHFLDGADGGYALAARMMKSA